ncbi:hypothetical protein [Candidatus Mesenet endosymbiont of Phosphuga atrata]|uniref:hypothetical protein n=1 Tax=Candidatus Mesenet endosymbiont of Phosphuga atrata TaxID=3066221 RepID=UPI0030D278DF
MHNYYMFDIHEDPEEAIKKIEAFEEHKTKFAHSLLQIELLIVSKLSDKIVENFNSDALVAMRFARIFFENSSISEESIESMKERCLEEYKEFLLGLNEGNIRNKILDMDIVKRMQHPFGTWYSFRALRPSEESLIQKFTGILLAQRDQLQSSQVTDPQVKSLTQKHSR